MENKPSTNKEIRDQIDTIVTMENFSLDYSIEPQYTVKELAKILGLSVHTIRFYDKERLFPFVTRDKETDERLFSDADRAFGKLTKCLRQLGLSIQDCRLFILDTLIGDETIKERLMMLISLQEQLKAKIRELQEAESDLQYKIRFFSYLDEDVEEEKEKGTFIDKKRGTLSKLHRFVLKQKALM